MTRPTRDQRRSHSGVHGYFATVPGFVANFVRLFTAKKQQGILVLNFSQWRAKKWGGPCHSPASAEERFEYRIYLDQMSKIDDGPAQE